MALIRARLAAAALLLAGPAFAQSSGGSEPAPQVAAPFAPPQAFRPADEAAQPDVWIFSGELQSSHETFSGTLVTGKAGAEFELKLASGATCDSSNTNADIGVMRLPEITCTDDRVMRALFVPQGARDLKVFGDVGDERFVSSAHLLGGDQAAPDKSAAGPKR